MERMKNATYPSLASPIRDVPMDTIQAEGSNDDMSAKEFSEYLSRRRGAVISLYQSEAGTHKGSKGKYQRGDIKANSSKAAPNIHSAGSDEGSSNDGSPSNKGKKKKRKVKKPGLIANTRDLINKLKLRFSS